MTKNERSQENYQWTGVVQSSQTKENESKIMRWIEFVDKDLVDSPHPEVHHLQALMKFVSSRFGDKECYGYRKVIKIHKEEKDGKSWEFRELTPYQWLSYNQVNDMSNKIGFGLRNIGLNPKDRLAIFEETRLEWALLSHACFSQNITLLTVYANLGEDALVYALNLGQITHLVTNIHQSSLIEKIADKVNSLKVIIATDYSEASEEEIKKMKSKLKVIAYEELLKLGTENPVDFPLVTPEDIALIMFTSGSTGVPKGVLISHRNIVACLGGVLARVGQWFREDDSYLGYLPLAHILAFIIQFGAMFIGIRCGFGSPRTFLDSQVRNCKGDLKELQPSCLPGVPTIFEKIKNGVERRINQSGFVKKWLFKIAFHQKLKAIKKGEDSPLWNKLVFHKLSDALGGKCRFAISGGAPLSPQLAEFIHVCFGIAVQQGYGLTETVGASFVQGIEDKSLGNVGCPVGSIEFKLVDVPEMEYSHTDKPNPRGEIFLRGPSVALGYFKNEEKTKEDFKDGWFATGDIGMLLPNGTLQIIDRKKNLIKAPHGEYIAIEKLESIYKDNDYVENLLVYIDGDHNDIVAIISPKQQALQDLAAQKKIKGNFTSLTKNKTIKQEILKSIQHTGKKCNLKSIEIIKNIYIDDQEWTTENNMLTAAMKLQRQQVLKHFKENIQQLYKEIQSNLS